MNFPKQILAFDYNPSEKQAYFLDDAGVVNCLNSTTKHITSCAFVSSKDYKDLELEYEPFAMGYPYYIKGRKNRAVITSDIGVFILQLK